MQKIGKVLKVLFCIFVIAIGLYGGGLIYQTFSLAMKEKIAFSYLALEAQTLESKIDLTLSEMKKKCPSNIPPKLIGEYAVAKSTLKYELTKTHTDEIIKLLNSTVVNRENLTLKLLDVETTDGDYNQIAKLIAKLLSIYERVLIRYGECVENKN